jgi:LysM repeat protein
MRHTVKYTFYALLTVIILMAVQPIPAQAGSALKWINSVYRLPANLGLGSIIIDDSLMGFFLQRSEHLISPHSWKGKLGHDTRPHTDGIKDYVKMESDVNLPFSNPATWSDWVHWQTTTLNPSKRIGAGVSVANEIIKYTLSILPAEYVYRGNKGVNQEVVTVIEQQDDQVTPVIISQIATSTPDADGIIIHTVKYGETLWSISEAYNVPIDEILRNSGMNPTRTEVFEGQELLIQAATEFTQPLPDTPTPEPDTPTPAPTQPRPTMTPLATWTPAPSPTPTQPPSVWLRALGDSGNVGMGLILISGLGLILVIYLGFLKNS